MSGGAGTAAARKRRARISFADFVERVYQPKYLANKGPNTQRHERAIVTGHLAKALGARLIGDIEPDEIRSLLSGHDHYLQRAIRNTAANIFTAARNEKLYSPEEALPTGSVWVPEGELRLPPTLTIAEIRAAYQKLATPVKELVLMVCLGPSISEALGAKLERCNLRSELSMADGKILQPFSLSIVEWWSLNAGNGRGRVAPVSQQKRRIVPLPRFLCECVAAYIEQRGKWQSPDDFLFVSRGGRTRGRPFYHTNLRSLKLQPVEKELGIENLSWRCLRHSGAVLAEAIGLNSAERAWLYGLRRDPITGSRRESIDPDRVREVVNELAVCIAEGKELKRLSSATPAAAGLLAAEPAGSDEPGDHNSPSARQRRAERFVQAMRNARHNRGRAVAEMGIDPKTLRKAENQELISKKSARAIDAYNREHLDA